MKVCERDSFSVRSGKQKDKRLDPGAESSNIELSRLEPLGLKYQRIFTANRVSSIKRC